MTTPAERTREHVAIIGMSCRFPGADGVAAFWDNLIQGRDTITRYAGDGDDVLAHGLLDRPEWFDAEYFRVSQREARLLSPQHRVFLECAVEALEGGGYDPDRYAGRIGVYASGADTGYAQVVRSQLHRLPPVGDWEILLGNAPEYMAARVAYKLNLRGPSIAVQAACASSLVALHVAIQGLLADDCDMALAGAASVHVPSKLTPYTPGGVISKQGVCRSFDASADGTVGTDGVGVVLLKRLDDALTDGDVIYAVVRGSAVDNDGAGRIGFTAPSVDGQARVIRDALRTAGVSAASLGYVEAHGTATALGDPIELSALTRAFREHTDASGYCSIGSVKSNIGHADVAAGMAGLIKTALALSHGRIPPSLHFEQPNPHIDFAATPFRVATRAEDWPRTSQPRRAGVSSFGIGGTNAHVVLEEAPPQPASPPGHPWQLLVVSAEQPRALEQATDRLIDYLRAHPSASLADVAWTLQTGRRALALRTFVVARDREDALAALTAVRAGAGGGEAVPAVSPHVVLRFPGSLDEAETARLFAYEPSLREAVDACLPSGREPSSELRCFAVQHAVAGMLEAWGVKPDTIVGERAGAWAAAVCAGVLSVAQAVALIEASGAGPVAFDARLGDIHPAPTRTRLSFAGHDRVFEPGERVDAHHWSWCAYGLPDVRASEDGTQGVVSIDVVGAPADDGARADAAVAAAPPQLLVRLGRVWSAGLPVDWRGVHGAARRRVLLPAYPFQRARYLVDADEARAATPAPIPAPVPAPAVAANTADAHAPARDFEADLTRLYAEILGMEAVGADDSFFDLGGDSLIAATLFERIAALFQVTLDPLALYDAETPRQLAELVRLADAEVRK
ncbi:type I polyketide synthase [Burkholderia sp. LMG 32019]|uniref:type I polyketide synthase n=1 Tax=Burkholderia sp. LMG 32019 TaxID=3158173 RepID=UPI003C308400